MTTTATYNAFFHTIRKTAREWGQTATTAASAIWSSVYAYARPDYYETHPLNLPLVDPAVWECHSTHHAWRDGCPTCSWRKGIWSSLFGDEWRESSSNGQVVIDESFPNGQPRWRSAEQALVTYGTADSRFAPPGGKTLGRFQDAAEQAERLARSRGRMLSSDELQALVRAEVGARGGPARDPLSRSDDYVEVRRVLESALATPQQRAGLSFDDAVNVLLCRVVGVWHREKTSGLGRPWTRPVRVPVEQLAEYYEITPAAVRGLVRRAMHEARVSLSVRGLCPMPKAGTRAHVEAHARRKRLGGDE